MVSRGEYRDSVETRRDVCALFERNNLSFAATVPNFVAYFGSLGGALYGVIYFGLKAKQTGK